MAADTVFVLDGLQDINISENIVVTRDDMWDPLFTGDRADTSEHTNNIYWDNDDGTIELGVELGSGEFMADPLFVDFNREDYRILPGSPAEGLGALSDERVEDKDS